MLQNIRSLVSTTLKYDTTPYPRSDPSLKWWSSARQGFPMKSRMKQRSMVSSDIPSKVSSHNFHCRSRLSLIFSSHPIFWRQSSCSSILAGSIISGDTNPNGWYIALIIDKIPRRVTGLTFLRVLNWNTSSSTFHLNPRTFSPQSCVSKSIDTAPTARSSSGISASNCGWLLFHFVRWNPPFFNRSGSSSTNFEASSTVGTQI